MEFEDLKEFCDLDVLRFEKPWVKNGFAYATNGHMGVKIPSALTDTNYDHPNLDELMNNAGDNCRYQIDFTVDINLRMKPLYKIEKEEVLCKKCAGDGEYNCLECGNLRRCPECDGSGILREAVYSKDIEKMVPDEKVFVKIGDAFFNPRYIFLLKKYFPQKGIITRLSRISAAKIKFDDAEIILMPVRDDGIEEFIELPITRYE